MSGQVWLTDEQMERLRPHVLNLKEAFGSLDPSSLDSRRGQRVGPLLDEGGS